MPRAHFDNAFPLDIDRRASRSHGRMQFLFQLLINEIFRLIRSEPFAPAAPPPSATRALFKLISFRLDRSSSLNRLPQL